MCEVVRNKNDVFNGSLPLLTFSIKAVPPLLRPLAVYDCKQLHFTRKPSSSPMTGFYGVTVALYLHNYFSISAMNISNTAAQLFYSPVS